jgi:hypothetical protein
MKYSAAKLMHLRAKRVNASAALQQCGTQQQGRAEKSVCTRKRTCRSLFLETNQHRLPWTATRWCPPARGQRAARNGGVK